MIAVAAARLPGRERGQAYAPEASPEPCAIGRVRESRVGERRDRIDNYELPEHADRENG
jgi:hypothetical protein